MSKPLFKLFLKHMGFWVLNLLKLTFHINKDPLKHFITSYLKYWCTGFLNLFKSTFQCKDPVKSFRTVFLIKIFEYSESLQPTFY